MNNPFSARHLRPGVLPYFFLDGTTLQSLDDALRENGGRGQIVGPHGTGKSTLLTQWCEWLEGQGVSVTQLRFQSCHPPSCHPPAGTVASRRAGRGVTLWRLLLDSARKTLKLFSLCYEIGNGERENGATLLPSPSLRLRPSRNSLVPRKREGDVPQGDDIPRGDILQGDKTRRLVVIDGYEQLHWWQRRLVERCLSWCGVGLLVTTHHDVGLKTIWRTPSSSRLAHTIATRLVGCGGGEIPPDVVDRLWQRCRGDIRETLFALYDWIETDVAVIATPAKSA